MQTISQHNFSLFYKLSQQQDERMLQSSKVTCFLFMMKENPEIVSVFSSGRSGRVFIPQISSWPFFFFFLDFVFLFAKTEDENISCEKDYKVATWVPGRTQKTVSLFCSYTSHVVRKTWSREEPDGPGRGEGSTWCAGRGSSPKG